MSVETTRRPPRLAIPQPERTEIVMQAPPTLPQPSSAGKNGMQMLFYLPMLLGMGAMGFFFVARAGGVFLIIFGVFFVVVLGGMLMLGLARGGMARAATMNDDRREYMRFLDITRRRVREIARQQRVALVTQHPEPEGLATLVRSPRMWERRRGDPDVGQVRLGVGPQRLASPLQVPETAPVEDLDPLSATALRHFVRSYAVVRDLPVALSLRAFPRVSVAGERALAVDLVRAVLAQLVTFHSPNDVRVAACTSPESAAEWDWLKWLPHGLHRTDTDQAGPLRYWARDLARLEQLLGDDLGARPRFSRSAQAGGDQAHVVVVVDGGDTRGECRLADETGLQGVTVIDLGGDRVVVGPYGARLYVEPQRVGLGTAEGVALLGRPDRLGAHAAGTLSRALTRHHTSHRRDVPRGQVQPLSGDVGFAELLGLGDVRSYTVDRGWRPRSAHSRLRIPFGVDPNGEPVEIDFKESAEEGMGPHGLVIGATGSGKSELLRTLVLGLAATHSSETLNFVLVDFKGGATFAGLGGLPHTAAVITNLADDSTLVNRMRDALAGELVRRQEVLRDAGNYASVRDYERARQGGAQLAPLPTLMVIIDEFSELLSSQPEFIDLFVMIGRLGRSLAVHLMLASQRLEEGRLRGLDSHLSYRIGLRTFSASESRTVLGVPDAGKLPAVPGLGFLRVDAETLVRFKAAYVSGPVPSAPSTPRVERGRQLPRTGPSLVRPFALDLSEAWPAPIPDVGPAMPAPQPEPAGAGAEEVAEADAETVTDVLVSAMAGQGAPAHQVWLPPLRESAPLDRVLPPLHGTPERGLAPRDWPAGGLTVPIAVVDKPYEQRQDLLWVRLDGAAGHVAVVGAPRSGKSNLVRTLVMSLALTHTPREVQFYCLDFGGGSLAALAELPHVGGVAGRLETERASRLVAEVTAVLEERERVFLEHGIDSVDTLRARRAAGERFGDRDFGDVFLVVDGWLTLKEDFERLYDSVVTLVGRGLTYGVHIVMTANRWMEIRAQVKDLVGTRLELRLGDPLDSDLGRKIAAEVPEGVPGRGMSREKLHFLTALPRIDGASAVDDLGEGVQAAVRRVAQAWSGPPAPPVRLLPATVSSGELDEAVEANRPRVVPSSTCVPIGLSERDLRPAYLDFDTDPHLLVYGDGGSGKSGLLRLVADQLAVHASPDQARLLVFDYRRGLLGELSERHVVGYCGSAKQAADLVTRARLTLEERMPGPDVTPAQLRRRGWWRGPELYVLVDDLDLVATGRENPLEPLAEYLPHARDVGFHLVVARRSGGASRAAYDPVIQRLTEVGAAGLLLSGSKDDGVSFGGVRMSPREPGRGVLIRRNGGPGLVQLGWRPPTE